MKPFDPRLVREIPETRTPVAALGLLGGLSGVAAISGAFAISALVVAVVRGHSLFAPALAVAIVFACRGLLALITEQVASWAATRICGALRRDYLERALAASADERPDTAAVMTTATHGASSVEPYVARYLPALVSAAVVPPLAVLCLFFVDWSSALIVILTLPLLPLFAALIGKYTEVATARRWKSQTRLAGHFLDVMRGLPTLVSYGRAERQAEQVDEVGDRHRVATVGTLRIAFMSSAALELLATISVAIVAVWTGMRLAWDELDLGIALTAILLAPEAYWPIRRVGQEFHAAADGVEAIASLLPQAGAEPADRVPSSARTLTAVDVSYRYPGTDRDVLHDVSLSVGSGLTVIAGASGCGKSTLLELLAGLRTPTSGTIEHPATHTVSQTPFIAPMTVRDNLVLGTSGRRAASELGPSGRRDLSGSPRRLAAGSKPAGRGAVSEPDPAGRRVARELATERDRSGSPRTLAARNEREHSWGGSDAVTGAQTDNRLAAAMAATGFDHVVASLPLGLETPLGDNGFGLSAGQRARLVLTRAWRSDAEVILLDEPTAHLDPEAATDIREVIVRLSQQRPVVVVSHDESLIDRADHVFDDFAVVTR